MQDMNRVVILFMLIGLLYALYIYQQKINASIEHRTVTKKPIKKPIKHIKPKIKKPVKTVEEEDNVSLGSLKDMESVYKQDSMMGDSLASGSLSFLDDKSNADSLFF